jgi:uncharacterized protein (TIGR04141 family)
MPALTVYKLREHFEGSRVDDFDRYLAEGRNPDALQVVEIPGAEAKLYVWSSYPRTPRWESFLRTGWDDVHIPARSPVGALVILRTRIGRKLHYFAIPFGNTGRYILHQAAVQRAYGLRTALNIMYPRRLGHSEQDATRVIGLDTKQRGSDVMRARLQSSAETTFETFGIDQLRDVVDAATGRPAEIDLWGSRIHGADGLTFSLETDVHGLGDICRRVEAAHSRDDYRARFPWIDHVQPVNDPEVRARLENEVVSRLRDGDIEDLDLAPPQIVNWEAVDGFRFHTDGHRGTTHRQLRLADYRRALGRVGRLDDLSYAQLHQGFIKALDGDGTTIHEWSVWRTIVGTVDVDDSTYVIEDGEFFTVAPDYLAELDDFTDNVGSGATSLPKCGVGVHEKDYNIAAAEELGVLLMDRETVTIPSRTTAIELCDLLTKDRELIHVKREFGSRDLSHLFSQGTTSAELIHDDHDFRSHVQKKVAELAGDAAYSFFDETGISPSAFRVTYAVIGDWRGKSPSERLSFFSKVNLRRAVRDLSRLGYNVAFQQVTQEQVVQPK